MEKKSCCHRVRRGEEARHGIRNEDGVVGDFRLPEGIDALAERTHYHERQAAELDHLTDRRIGRAIHGVGQVLRDDRHFAAGLGVVVFEETARKHVEIAHPEIFCRDAEHQHIALPAAGHSHAVVQLDQRGGRRDVRHLLAYRVQVVDRHVIVGRLGAVDRSAFVVGGDHVDADRLDLLQHVLLARKADGHDQDQRRRADHHAERRERVSDLVGAEGLDGNAHRFAQDEFRVRAAVPAVGCHGYAG